MHLLAAAPGTIADGAEAQDLGQTSGDIVVLSAADTELACLASAQARMGAGAFSLRLANLSRLSHNMSVDLYVENTLAGAKLIVVRLLGGRSYWPYGVEQIEELARARNIKLAFLPGDDRPDVDLLAASTLPPADYERLWRYLTFGGLENAEGFLRATAALLGGRQSPPEPKPLPQAGLYRETGPGPGVTRATVVFYRALLLAGDLRPVDSLLDALNKRGVAAQALYVQSLKDESSAALIAARLAVASPDVVVNLTGFAVAAPGSDTPSPFASADCPVIQAILAGTDEDDWRNGVRGLAPRDIAMNVALPEVDGRLISRAISFKQVDARDPLTQCDLAFHAPVVDRIAFVADLACAWARLRQKPPGERRVALVLANYPNRDGRLGNGVGLDTPASTVGVLQALKAAGYDVAGAPDDGDALMRLMLAGPTNDFRALEARAESETLALPDYLAFWRDLPASAQDAVQTRWGKPEADPFFRAGELDCGRFLLPILRFGKLVVAVQPARGYNIDPQSSYHDPALPPPHNYLAFYAWLRQNFATDAIVHMGKHGNLEWLPGKAIALSSECFSEAALGPLPHLYPFIVNDPGEGAQAKRRAAAVIIDHLTPPLTRAESYGPLRELERLVDEYYDASGLDPRRLKALAADIVAQVGVLGLDRDLGLDANASAEDILTKLDRHLCELKELQIRDGLHIFGQSPTGGLADDLLVALARVPRGGRAEDESLLRALSRDLDLGFDPLDCDMGAAWNGPRPDVLKSGAAWRSQGDTIERLEALARALVAGECKIDASWTRTRPVLDQAQTKLRPALAACGGAEIAALLTGLDGRFVPPGPSGAPTRGRPDVLPTGRNFYSVDTRTVPTPAAWTLGWKSAMRLLERHLQDHGAWPKAMAISAWGTSNMRTGGDDIAQVLALMGVRPQWETASRRVIGFEILPLSVLDRPRVDVTLRVSGFFRDAFPALMDLVDSAARAVAALDEPEADNPLAARVREDARKLLGQGIAPDEANRRAGFRVFGSKPGAYGAGLQALIDEKGWRDVSDFADAYLAWGGYAYGGGAAGASAREAFSDRLAKVDAVVQNQDNREHDLLDSDDYYQFEGGLAAAARALSGKRPALYHMDHARPETPQVRTLDEEIARIVRGRAANPKWIAGVMRHGYKGAFEMAATVDYLFAFAATAEAVGDHHFDALFTAYIEDESVRAFFERSNPAALREMAARFEEAITRGLWHPRSNHARVTLDALAKGRETIP